MHTDPVGTGPSLAQIHLYGGAFDTGRATPVRVRRAIAIPAPGRDRVKRSRRRDHRAHSIGDRAGDSVFTTSTPIQLDS
jgi:hypothetical protein